MDTRFPEGGRPRAEIDAALDAMAAGDVDWRGGRVPLYVFGATAEVGEVGRDAFMRFFTENALGAKRAFTSLRRMEEEVVAMALDLFHGPEGAVGGMTSGGTESILLAVKACRDGARARRGDPAHRGNLVLPVSAHPAFDKAAALMDLPVRRIPVRADLRADVAAMAGAIDADTILLVGSVPCFPYGVVDPLPELSELALSRDLWLHVDACVGGYFAPFARELGRPIPEFDFALPGVASISADLHKFGFCPKPASTVFFRDAARAAGRGFDLDVWPNGRFATATFVGTRPGGGVAGAWAVLNFLGREGYRALAARLLAMRDDYVAGIRAIPGMRVFGEPDLSILAFGAEALDMGAVAAGMEARGWVPGLVREPPGLHIMMSLLHEPVRERYLGDLREAAAEAAPAQGAAVQAVY
ncbi:pyridoxal phosphate-dependent decarboxylase family protein [Roseomonas sp. BN140053]|uniref:pyridoxal phosphate-dependent decarboxylase family protein n=1 Tax=Roseomonas sp. BN140053 TaxID=3391898 RepID=UPI0039EA1EC5